MSLIKLKRVSFRLNYLIRCLSDIAPAKDFKVIEKKSVKEILDTGIVNEDVRVQGWVKAFRRQKDFVFLDLGDGLSQNFLPVVVSSKETPANLGIHTSVDLSGRLLVSPKNPNILELHPESEIRVIGGCKQDKYPLGGKSKYTAEYLRDYLHLRPKTRKFSSMLRLRSEVLHSMSDYFYNNDFVKVQTPVLTSNDCEGGGEIFTTTPDNQKLIEEMRKKDESGEKMKLDEIYFDTKTFLTVSSQLHLEAAAGGLEKVWTFTPVFRAENSQTTRHLSEFSMVEAEIAFVFKISQLLNIMENLVKFTIISLLEKNFKELNYYIDANADHLNLLEKIQRSSFTTMTYKEATEIIKNKTGVEVHKHKGLNREQELLLVEQNGQIPIFLISWPSQLKPFYMRGCEGDSTTVEGVDLLFPTMGEIAGGSLREHDILQLEERLKEKGLDAYQSLNWYLDLRRFGASNSGGFGLGFDRFIQFLTNSTNIKDVVMFPRFPHNCRM